MTVNDNIGCAACGLCDQCKCPNMPPGEYFDDYCDIMFVGEAPGATEDDQGTPFVGRSGKLLRDAVDSIGLYKYGYVFTNVVRCRPPNNKTPTKRQIGYCLPILKDEIEQYQPRLIILLGGTPLNAVLGESIVTNWRGTLIERDGLTYLPVFHPAYILRNTSALEEWVKDLEKAKSFLSGDVGTGNVSDEYELTLIETDAQAQDMYKTIKSIGFCAWDTETNGLRYGDELVMMSFAVDEPVKRAWAVPVPGCNKVCKRLLLDPDVLKVGHNIKFDVLAIHGNWNVEVQGIVGDSMLASYVLDPVPGRHGLKPLAGRHLGMYDYAKKLEDYQALRKDTNPKYGGDLRLVPTEVLAEYAALDAVATLELEWRLLDDMEDEQKIVYEQLLMPASATFSHLEMNGVVIDEYLVERYKAIYAEARDARLDELRSDEMIVAYHKFKVRHGYDKFEFNPNSSYQMRDVLYGCVVCPECHKTVANENVNQGRRHECAKCDTRFAATKSTMFKGYGLGITVKTSTGRPSTGWDVLKEYVEELPMLTVYRQYKLLGKMLSTYLEPAIGWKDKDGRVRSDYKIHGTDTGRASSRNPNLQNIPTPEKEPGTLLQYLPIKNIFTCTWPEGGCLLCADYSGMELRTMASVSECQGMIDIFLRGEDLHSIVTEFLYDIKREDYTPEEWKPIRYRAKWTNWTLLFGGSAYTLHRLYGLDKEEADRLVNRYYDLFPEVLEYKERTLAFAREHGYVRSMFGRRKYLPYINDWHDGKRKADERAGINMPIQSSAFDVLLCAMIILDECMCDANMRSLIVNTVHDSIMFDVYPGELEELAGLCGDVMEKVTSVYGPERFPGLDFSWFTVPLVVDMEIGTHYGSLTKWGAESGL